MRKEGIPDSWERRRDADRVGIAPASKGGQHGEAAPETRARSSESGGKLWSSVKGEVPMKKRNDPAGFPGGDRITQWYDETGSTTLYDRSLAAPVHPAARNGFAKLWMAADSLS